MRRHIDSKSPCITTTTINHPIIRIQFRRACNDTIFFLPQTTSILFPFPILHITFSRYFSLAISLVLVVVMVVVLWAGSVLFLLFSDGRGRGIGFPFSLFPPFQFFVMVGELCSLMCYSISLFLFSSLLSFYVHIV